MNFENWLKKESKMGDELKGDIKIQGLSYMPIREYELVKDGNPVDIRDGILVIISGNDLTAHFMSAYEKAYYKPTVWITLAGPANFILFLK